MAEPDVAAPWDTAVSSAVRSESHRRLGDDLVAGVRMGPTLRMCALFFAAWMTGDWIEDLHTPIRGVHAVGGAIATSACLLFLVSSYVAVRVWQCRHTK